MQIEKHLPKPQSQTPVAIRLNQEDSGNQLFEQSDRHASEPHHIVEKYGEYDGPYTNRDSDSELFLPSCTSHKLFIRSVIAESEAFARQMNQTTSHWQRRVNQRKRMNGLAYEFENEIAQEILHNSNKYKWFDLPPILRQIPFRRKTAQMVKAWTAFRKKYDAIYDEANSHPELKSAGTFINNLHSIELKLDHLEPKNQEYEEAIYKLNATRKDWLMKEPDFSDMFGNKFIVDLTHKFNTTSG